MGSHACDRVLRLCVAVTLLAPLAGCSGRSTNPEDNEPEPAIHEPWEDEEAELLALLMSGEFCAPRDLYERVQQDLAQIRSEWGDSIPELRTIRYRPLIAPSRISLEMVEDAYYDMKEGRYNAWDSLNEYYQLDSVRLFDPTYYYAFRGELAFIPRMNPRMLVEAYAGSPGVRRVGTIGYTISDRPHVYGYLHEFGAAYLFQHSQCYPPWDCSMYRYWYFRSTADGIEFAGEWNPQEDDGWPSWWEEAAPAFDLPQSHSASWEWENPGPPATITDLLVGNPGSNDVTLGWTAPLDSGYSGRVGSYRIMYSTSMITEETWASARYSSGPHPNLPGAQERFVLKGLLPSTSYYFGVKSRDAAGAWSALSNTANVSTTPAYGWTTFDSTNSVLQGNRIEAIAADRRGGVWFGTSRGIAHFDGTRWRAYTSANSQLTDDWITGIAVDEADRMWCITYRGVAMFDGNEWMLFGYQDIGLPGSPYRVAAGPSGHIWVSGANVGVAAFDGINWTVDELPVENPYGWVCQSIAVDADGGVWFATLGAGVFRFDGTAWTAFSRENSGLGANSVYSIAAGSDGSVWFGHDDYNCGASRFDGTDWTRFAAQAGSLPSNRNRFLMVDSLDRVWFASAGLARFDGISWSSRKATSSGLVSDNVICIAQDAQGNMWFGTDKGVSRLAAEYVETYFGTVPEGGL